MNYKSFIRWYAMNPQHTHASRKKTAAHLSEMDDDQYEQLVRVVQDLNEDIIRNEKRKIAEAQLWHGETVAIW